jgi:hypothetical protein
MEEMEEKRITRQRSKRAIIKKKKSLLLDVFDLKGLKYTTAASLHNSPVV